MKIVKVNQWDEEVQKHLVKEQSQEKQLKNEEKKLKKIIGNLE